MAKKKAVDGSGGSFISELSPAVAPKSKEFIPIFNDMENDGEPRVEQSKNSSDEDMIKVNEIKLSPHRYNEKADKNSFVTNFNEISAINNTTVGPDTSLNTSQLQLIRKLHEKAVGSAQKPDNYDT